MDRRNKKTGCKIKMKNPKNIIMQLLVFLRFFFPELSSNSLASIIEGYKASKVWPTKTDLPASAFVKLKAALLSGNLIQFDIPYDEVIDENLSKAD